jgi:hypothetical protein
MSRDALFRLSGFWHQRQRIVHPARNTIVRIPYPSVTQYRCIADTCPVILLSHLTSLSQILLIYKWLIYNNHNLASDFSKATG